MKKYEIVGAIRQEKNTSKRPGCLLCLEKRPTFLQSLYSLLRRTPSQQELQCQAQCFADIPMRGYLQSLPFQHFSGSSSTKMQLNLNVLPWQQCALLIQLYIITTPFCTWKNKIRPVLYLLFFYSISFYCFFNLCFYLNSQIHKHFTAQHNHCVMWCI